MNSKVALLSFLVIMFSAFSIANAVVTKSVRYNVVAGATFASIDNESPRICHKKLAQVSRYNCVITIEGTACDNDALSLVNIYWHVDDADVSTKTYTLSPKMRNRLLPSTTTYFFSFNLSRYIPRFSDDAKKLYYSISSVDESGNYCFWFDAEAQISSGTVKTKKIIPFTHFNVFNEVGIGFKSIQKVGTSGGVIRLSDSNPNDGETSIEVPPGALASDVNITIDEIDPNSVARGNSSQLLSQTPVAVYQFGPDGTTFTKPVKLSMLYKDENQDGLVDGTIFREDSLRIMWWDGFDWRSMVGNVDIERNEVSANISHFSIYAAFPASNLANSDYAPKEKIITPATIDARNDVAIFDNLDPSDTIMIYDVTGRGIRKIESINTWDGKDDSGNIVESGLYIYQIKKKDKIISGTIVVAK